MSCYAGPCLRVYADSAFYATETRKCFFLFDFSVKSTYLSRCQSRNYFVDLLKTTLMLIILRGG